MKNSFLLLLSVLGACVLLYALKKIKLRYVLLSALSGLCALFASDFICSFFDMEVKINAFSLSLSAIGGIPGVILLNVLNTVFFN